MKVIHFHVCSATTIIFSIKSSKKLNTNVAYMLIPICTQFHYAYRDSPYANFSGSPHVHI